MDKYVFTGPFWSKIISTFKQSGSNQTYAHTSNGLLLFMFILHCTSMIFNQSQSQIMEIPFHVYSTACIIGVYLGARDDKIGQVILKNTIDAFSYTANLIYMKSKEKQTSSAYKSGVLSSSQIIIESLHENFEMANVRISLP